MNDALEKRLVEALKRVEARGIAFEILLPDWASYAFGRRWILPGRG
jgi:hypothetical protein